MLPDVTPLQLNEDDRDQIVNVTIDRIKDSVRGAAYRDYLLAELDDQLEGRAAPTLGRQRWRNACALEDPITREFHTQVTAQFQASRRDPLWQVEATTSADKVTAQKQELFLTAKKASDNLDMQLYNLAYNAGRDPAAVLHAGWKQVLKPKRKLKYRNTESDVLVDPEERLDGLEYEAITVTEPTLEHEGMDYRTVDLVDWYVYPANARSIEHATGVGERIRFTEEDLLDGIENYGFDPYQVEELISRGPTHGMDGSEYYPMRDNADDETSDVTRTPFVGTWDSTDGTIYHRREDRIDGTRAIYTHHRDGLYECYLFFSRCPALRDEGGELIDMGVDRSRDLMFLCCPQHRICFKMVYSPYSRRPYFLFSMLFRPNRLQGLGVCQLLQQIQFEATTRLRNTIDAADLETSPTVVVPGSQYKQLSKFGIYPGCVLPEEVPGSIRVLAWSRNSQMGWQESEWLRGRAQSVISAQGYGQVNQKQPLVAEMEGVMSATDTKFDLFLFCFNAGLADLAPWIIEQYAQHANDATVVRGPRGEDLAVTVEDLQKTFRYIPAATSQSSNPQIKLAQAQKKFEVTLGYFNAIQQFPQFAALVWHAVREVLVALGEANPEAFIGDEPQPMLPAMPDMPPGMQPPGEPPAVSPFQLLQLGQGGGSANAGNGLGVARAPGPMV